LNKARITRLPLALTYGMTETASQVTSLKPVEFLAGNHSCGRALPHAKIQLISNDDDRFQSIQIQSSSLMLGYFPDFNPLTYFDTDDLGAFDRNGYLTIIGRNSSKIITGGENVFPIEVINAIMSTELVADVWVIGLPDRYWGQVITAVYVEKDDAVSGDLLARAIAGKISNYKIPKLWFPTTELPRNTLGKILTQEVEKFASARRLFNN
jgi:o-succinylbenzoate---CoA ligase